MKKIFEVEVRTFLSEKQYSDLKKRLVNVAEFLEEIGDETLYFSTIEGKDLRLRRDDRRSYLILKEGFIHDDSREEIEIAFKAEEFDKMKHLLQSLGFSINCVWFRKRLVYSLGDIKIYLDDTKGYGKIIELEKLTNKQNQEKTHRYLKDKLEFLGIKKITTKEEFNKKFEYYKKNWKKILNYQI